MKFYALIIFIFFGTSSMAQLKKEVLVRNYNPIVIIDTFQTTFRTLILDNSLIKKVNKVKIKTASCNCAPCDVAVIETKNEHIELVRIDKVFDFFHISAEDRKLKISINNILIKNPETILANISNIKNVEITDFIYTEQPASENQKDRYLNIRI